MKVKANLNRKIACYVIIAVCLLLQLLMFLLKDKPEWVELYYSQGFYPVISYLSVVLFSWLPFSIGDILYLLIVFFLGLLLFRAIRALGRRQWGDGSLHALQLLTFVSLLYTFFHINWGLNYYRQPIAVHMNLHVDETHARDYVDVLGKYIVMANMLREELDMEDMPRKGVKMDLETYVREDTVFKPLLSKTQVQTKSPLSSRLISRFTVSGYFNPFTMEAQVNQEIPNTLYPFVYVHELAHQMGVGFEDECNFIAFRILVDHKNSWYRYAAYYAAIQSLLRPLSGDKGQLERVKNMLSEKVRDDFRDEYAFWLSKKGWLDTLSGIFYNQYLKHNNQPEGLARYDMMAKLIVAWEKQQRHEMSKEEKYKLYTPSLTQ